VQFIDPLGCDACAEAEKWPGSGLFHASCNECQTRQTANGLAFHVWKACGAKLDTYPDKYSAQLERIARPGETLRQTHDRVRALAARMQQSSASASSAGANWP
jgi:hypothetical protein